MGQSLFKKYSKSQKFNEILCCGMTRFRNVELDVFRQYQNTFGTESFSETFKIPKISFLLKIGKYSNSGRNKTFTN